MPAPTIDIVNRHGYLRLTTPESACSDSAALSMQRCTEFRSWTKKKRLARAMARCLTPQEAADYSGGIAAVALVATTAFADSTRS
jgi:hypothetical protein